MAFYAIFDTLNSWYVTKHWDQAEVEVFDYREDGSDTPLSFTVDFIYYIEDRQFKGRCTYVGRVENRQNFFVHFNPKQPDKYLYVDFDWWHNVLLLAISAVLLFDLLPN